VALGFALASSQGSSRADLDQRFATRAELSSRFTSSYTTDILARERAAAVAHLAASTISQAEFERVTHDLGFEAAVLLDADGRLLSVVPSNPAIVGTVIAPRYAHLTRAVAGQTAISGVVPGAATGRPVVAFATPFPANGGGARVFSGAFDIGSTPLGAYLQDALPYRGPTVDLVDQSGKIVATSRSGISAGTLRGVDPALAAAARGPSAGSLGSGGARRHYVAVRPEGTPWMLINAVPESSLYSNLGGSALVVPWLVLAGLSIAGALVLILFIRLGESRARLALTALTDPLTGIANRRAWDAGATRELARAGRAGIPLSLAILDLDLFKAYNDHHGHRAGDELLVAASRAWNGQLREGDQLARLGGEEFGVLLPGADIRLAAQIVERLRAATPVGSTASAGCAEWDTIETPAELMERADQALYAAKDAGRNQMAIAPTAAVLATAESSRP